MALGGVTIGWDESTPSSSSNAGLGEQDIRSVKTSVRNALDSEHLFSATGGANSGAHRAGSGRAFYAAASAVSSSDTDGRLMVTSDTTRLYHVGSSGTALMGGRLVVEGSNYSGFGSVVSSTLTQTWGTEVGAFLMTSTGTVITLRHTWVRAVVNVGPSYSSAGVALSGPMVYTPIAALPVLTNTNVMTVYNFATGGAQTSCATPYDVSYTVMGWKAQP